MKPINLAIDPGTANFGWVLYTEHAVIAHGNLRLFSGTFTLTKLMEGVMKWFVLYIEPFLQHTYWLDQVCIESQMRDKMKQVAALLVGFLSGKKFTAVCKTYKPAAVKKYLAVKFPETFELKPKDVKGKHAWAWNKKAMERFVAKQFGRELNNHVADAVAIAIFQLGPTRKWSNITA